MANCQDVTIEGRVPFNWLTDTPIDVTKSEVTAEDIAFLGRIFLSPSMGLELTYIDDGYEPNARGGKTSMYRLAITGVEALRMGTMLHLVDIIRKAGEVTMAIAVDLDDGSRAVDLLERAR